jgi:hypothetical protein
MPKQSTTVDSYTITSQPSSQPSTETTHYFSPPPRHNATTYAKLFKTATTTPLTPQQHYQLHIDGSENRSITNDDSLLLHRRHIRPYYMSSASQEDSIKCTALGYLPWRAPNGYTILIKCYYSGQATDTIISPSDVVLTNKTAFKAWTQHADMTRGSGYISFSGTSETLKYPLYERNGLWYYEYDDFHDIPTPTHDTKPMVQRLTTTGLYGLLHARLGHPGETVMSQISHHVVGLLKLRKPTMFKCHTCLLVNATKRAVTNRDLPTGNNITITEPQATKVTPAYDLISLPPDTEPGKPNMPPGTFFQMDMGYVRGTKYRVKDTDGNIVTSLDGYNSYLLVEDRATRYTWVFLCRYKVPQIELLRTFLETHGSKSASIRRIRSDKGGELWGSHDFHKMAKELGFILEPKATDSSFQNGVAERPNRSLADIMHRAINMTPYQAYTGHKPDLKKLRVF